MKTSELAGLSGFEVLVQGEENEITGIYCADLLSWAMGCAPEGCAWCTIMGNVNAIAVASLADVAVVVLCENAVFDGEAKTKAEEQGINVVKTGMPSFMAGVAIAKKAGLL